MKIRVYGITGTSKTNNSSGKPAKGQNDNLHSKKRQLHICRASTLRVYSGEYGGSLVLKTASKRKWESEAHSYPESKDKYKGRQQLTLSGSTKHSAPGRYRGGNLKASLANMYNNDLRQEQLVNKSVFYPSQTSLVPIHRTLAMDGLMAWTRHELKTSIRCASGGRLSHSISERIACLGTTAKRCASLSVQHIAKVSCLLKLTQYSYLKKLFSSQGLFSQSKAWSLSRKSSAK